MHAAPKSVKVSFLLGIECRPPGGHRLACTQRGPVINSNFKFELYSIMEAVGFIALWGFTPSIDFFRGTPHSYRSDKDINVLISECADIRHLMRSLSNNVEADKLRDGTLNIYIHEKQRENICRAILFLTIMCEKQLSMRER